jgi:hypothetical protein
MHGVEELLSPAPPPYLLRDDPITYQVRYYLRPPSPPTSPLPPFRPSLPLRLELLPKPLTFLRAGHGLFGSDHNCRSSPTRLYWHWSKVCPTYPSASPSESAPEFSTIREYSREYSAHYRPHGHARHVTYIWRCFGFYCTDMNELSI